MYTVDMIYRKTKPNGTTLSILFSDYPVEKKKDAKETDNLTGRSV
jgi:hypothetical protein